MAMVMAFDCDASAAARNATLGPLEIDYLYIHYCVFAGAPLASYAALLLWLCLLFFFLGSTADGYFSPTLASISDKLRVPYDVAGVTFLAFGNGAPDVFSAIAAYSSGVGEAGINELLGGSMFVSNVVVGCVALASTVNVQRWAFSRDVFALIGSLLLLLALTTHRGPATPSYDGTELLFLAVYVLYVSSVVLPECITRFRFAERESKRSGGDDGARGVLSAFWHALSPRGPARPDPSAHTGQGSYVFLTKQDVMLSTGASRMSSPRGVELSSPRRKAPTFSSDVVENHFQDFASDEASLKSPLISDDERTVMSEDLLDDFVSPEWVRFSNGAKILEGAYLRHLRWRWRLKRRIVAIYGGSESALVKVLSLPNIVLVLIRDFTVPLLDQDTWSRSMAMMSPITVPLLVLLTSGDIAQCVGPHETPLWMLVLVMGAAATLVVSLTTHRSHPPDSLLYCAFFLLLAFVACVCWIYTVANELVALLVAVGTITHASNSLLGLTVLSWGNSVGDLITNVSVARAGFPEMAIAGCYGGPVFNILLGLGIPMLMAFIHGEDQRLELDDHAWISMGFLFVTLVTSYWIFRRHDYHCPASYGKVQLAVYGVYTIVNVVLALQKGEDEVIL